MSATDSNDNHIEFLLRFAIQSLPDKKIRCPENWNVLQLKQFLEQDCSSKPAVDSQRLIYAGHCLKNEQLLKEIFDRNADRSNNEGNALQVVHLVCASPDQIRAAKQLSSNEGIRNRQQPTSSAFQQNNAAGPAPTQLPTFENIPQDVNTAYAQAYHSYLRNYYSQNRSINNAGIQFGIGRTVGSQVTVVQNAAAGVNPQIPVAENNIAAAHPELNDHPDVLDMVYKLVRFAFLAAIIFYSSLDRIIFVIGVICLMWYVQMRRERDNRNVRQQNERAQQNAPNVPNAQNVNQQAPNQQQAPAPNPNNNGNDSNNNELPAAAPQPQATGQSAWNVFWSTVISFFSSLIPEPVPVVN